MPSGWVSHPRLWSLTGGPLRSTYYAYTRSLDPGTGQIQIAGNNWVAGSPMVQVAIRILRTQRGTYLPDPTFGVDYSVVDKALPNAPATFKAELNRAFRSLVTSGAIANLSITVESSPPKLLWEITFTDVRLGERIRPLRGSV